MLNNHKKKKQKKYPQRIDERKQLYKTDKFMRAMKEIMTKSNREA